jgi:hypothetical protein
VEIRAPEYTIADYCEMLDRKEVRVNREYQRSDEVWPRTAQSFLVETILLNFPVPKLFLHQQADPRTGRPIKEIVDGQQRTKAIYDFFKDEYRLTSNITLEGAEGRRYSELPTELHDQFRDYGLQFDLFVGATDEDVREVFRRMNSFTVPLNPEEQRHAEYQGEFKWFMRNLSTDYTEAFRRFGTFTQKSLVRMQDQKLLTEICAAYWDGIRTTNKRTLNAVYKSHDRPEDFPEESKRQLDRRLRSGLDRLLTREELVGTPLTRPHQVYSLLLAVMHLEEPIAPLEHAFAAQATAGEESIVHNLSRLAEAVEAGEDDAGDLLPFVKASSDRTNVASQRTARFVWFCQALTNTLPA